MQTIQSSFAAVRTAMALALILLLWVAHAFAAPKYKVIHDFNIDGAAPLAGLILDTKGNLYGTTSGIGGKNSGTVFELSLSSGGQWTQSVLYQFSDGSDGGTPLASLVMDSVGRLYGTTSSGGESGFGTVFEMTPGSDTWTFGVIDTVGSLSGLLLDSKANLYGTRGNEGKTDEGEVFELKHGSNGWTDNVLYSFCSKPDCIDGSNPSSAVSRDILGNLYGITAFGGKNGRGTAFELKHRLNGSWTDVVAHSFHQGEVGTSSAGLTVDKAGNLYGVTTTGANSCRAFLGTVFMLMHNPAGGWKRTVLHNFCQYSNGAYPVATLTLDKAGNLYGTTSQGGKGDCENGCGVVFKLTPSTSGKWTYSVLHRFNDQDGAAPWGSVVLDSRGTLYGTTEEGGAFGYGVVFEITP